MRVILNKTQGMLTVHIGWLHNSITNHELVKALIAITNSTDFVIVDGVSQRDFAVELVEYDGGGRLEISKPSCYNKNKTLYLNVKDAKALRSFFDGVPIHRSSVTGCTFKVKYFKL